MARRKWAVGGGGISTAEAQWSGTTWTGANATCPTGGPPAGGIKGRRGGAEPGRVKRPGSKGRNLKGLRVLALSHQPSTLNFLRSFLSFFFGFSLRRRAGRPRSIFQIKNQKSSVINRQSMRIHSHFMSFSLRGRDESRGPWRAPRCRGSSQLSIHSDPDGMARLEGKPSAIPFASFLSWKPPGSC
jgi:hypothetical protein